MSGATISAPTASPNHQSTHAVPYESGRWSAIVSTVTPFVAATAVLRTAPKTVSARTDRTRSSSGRKPMRRMSAAPTMGSSVLPTAIAAETAMEESLVTLATKAPIATAGQNLRPRIRRAARAMPEGAQTGVMAPRATSRSRPTFAAPKYAPATTTNHMASRARPACTG
jgi:hypothetical protein